MRSLKRSWPLVVVHVVALSPLALLAWDFSQGQLGANPIRELQLRTGRYALLLLVLTLACSTVSALPGLKSVAKLRRTIGLYTFSYASLHLLNFVGLDYGFNFQFIKQDIVEKRFALAGLAAYLSLLPLAVTSTDAWIRRLGQNWQRLHRLVYLAGALAVLHFVWAVKQDSREPLLYGIAILLIALLRLIPPAAAMVRKLRDRMTTPRTNR